MKKHQKKKKTMQANIKSFCYYLIFCKRQLTVQIELAKTHWKVRNFKTCNSWQNRENIVRI